MATMQANTTLGCISKNPSWAQFRGQGGEVELKGALEELAAKITDDDFTELFLIDNKSLRKKLEASEFELKCRDFTALLEPSIHAVQKISTKLNKQYQVGQDA
jgi:hypothetical protein